MSIGRLENEADLARFIQGELGKPSSLTARIAEVEAHGGGTPDATASAKGILKLTGDLGGTADSPSVPGLAGKAAALHTHAQADIANLTSDLAGKAATGDSRFPTTDQKAALAGTSGTPGSGNKYVTDADSRLTNSRAPSGAAGGSLAGTYPNPTIGTGKVGTSELAANAVTAAKASTGTGSTNLAVGDDARFPSTDQKAALAGTSGTPGAANKYVTDADARNTNSRIPTGSAGGDLTGTYPNPTIDTGKVTDAKVASANKDGAAGTPSMRTLGTGATQAAAGNDARLSDQRTPLDNSVTSAKIQDGAIVNADVNASAGIAQSKIQSLTSDLALKAPLASPALTGNPTAPTQAPGTGKGPNGTRLASTQYADDADDLVRQGWTVKEPIDYVSTQKPSGTYTVTGNTLEANANGYLFPALGLTADRWVYDLTFQGWDNSGVELAYYSDAMVRSGSYVYVVGRTGLSTPNYWVIVKYDLNGTRQAQVVVGYGSSAGEIYDATDIAVDSTGKVYVLDQMSEKVSIWTSSLVYSSQWSCTPHPIGMCIDSSDRMTVSHGSTLKRYSLAGSGSTTLSIPSTAAALAVDPSGTVYCSASGNKVYKAPYGLGSYSTLTSIDNGNPWAIGAGSNCFWVTNGSQQIIQYDDGGGYISTSGGTGGGMGQYASVSALAAHGTGVFVGDPGNAKIEKLSYASPLAANNTVLLRHGNAVPQIPHKDNGTYTVTSPGSPSTKWKLTRRDLTLDPGTIVQARFEGSDPQPGMFYLPTPGPITVGTTPIIFEPYRQRPTAHGQTHAAGGTDPVGAHASVHASGGTDPLAVASLDPETVNMDGRFGEVGIGGNVVINSTSSGAKITNDFWIDVQAGEVALLVFKGTLLAATSNDWQFGVFDGKTSGGSAIMSYAYVSGTGGWVQFMTLGVAAPSSTTYYRGTAQRVYGSGAGELAGVSTRIYKIILGGKP